jgi:hypothetical protein
MRVTDLCPSPHLEALDVGDEMGDSKTVTMKSVEIKTVGADQVRKGVLYLEEFDRGLVLNKTNSRAIADLFGADTTAWIGQKLQLYRSETTLDGKTVPCIRVKAAKK